MAFYSANVRGCGQAFWERWSFCPYSNPKPESPTPHKVYIPLCKAADVASCGVGSQIESTCQRVRLSFGVFSLDLGVGPEPPNPKPSTLSSRRAMYPQTSYRHSAGKTISNYRSQNTIVLMMGTPKRYP